MGEEHDLSSAPGLGWFIILALLIGLVLAIVKGIEAIMNAIFG